MKVSELFTKTLRQAPADADDEATGFLIQAGYIAKMQAGVYAFLPLGLKVLDKINTIIRKHLNSIGAEELYLTVMQPKAIWEKTGRWTGSKDVMYQFKSGQHQGASDLGLAFTHEEPIASIARQFISSYRDLPKAVYQIQTKFRREPRAKSGLLRGREFLMKDLYSFHATEDDMNRYYELVKKTYLKIFSELGLDALVTEASGGVFSKYSHEFQVVSELGEDTIYYSKDGKFAQNAEIFDPSSAPSGVKEARAIEVGNIFKLGTRFSEPLGLKFTDPAGASHPVIMASYGIGPSRVMGTLAAVYHDESGLIWPAHLAPYQVYLIELGRQSGVTELAQKTASELARCGISYLYDDRDEPPGVKLNDADLLGMPLRVIASQKTASSGMVEIRFRNKEATELVKPARIKEILDEQSSQK